MGIKAKATWACVAVKHGSAPTITCLRIGQSCFILLVTISHLFLFKVRKAVSICVCIQQLDALTKGN